MKRTFVEITGFRKKVDKHGPEYLRKIQEGLLKRIDAGPVIPGTGGIRKVRVEDPSRRKGKRGGSRVIYLDLPNVEKTYLLALYGKDEQDDISSEEKAVLRKLVAQLKKEARENG